jgi:hypothetical protein
MVDVLDWRATPGYALCPAGAAGWFWVAWDTVPPDDANGASPPPRFAGYASTEEAAHAQARTAVALPPFRGALHGPGSQTRRRQQACAPSRVAAQILRQRTLQQRRARPSSRTQSQVSRLVYCLRPYYGAEACHEPGITYTPHRVLRESARFFWVNSESLEYEGWGVAHPEHLATYRLERVELERGERSWSRVTHAWWVLAVPPAAIEEAHGRWFVGAQGAARPQRTSAAPCLTRLGLTPPCTRADVTTAYHRLARTRHPDVGGSHDAFVALRASYEAALRLVANSPG